MSRPQSGIQIYPGASTLVRIFRIHDIPMSAMSVSKVAAIVPGLTLETGNQHPENHLVSLVGFGPRLAGFVWPASHPKGFSAFRSISYDEPPGFCSDADLLFFAASLNPGLNSWLADQVNPYLDPFAKQILEMSGQETVSAMGQEEIPPSRPVIGKEEPEFQESSFVCLRKWDIGQTEGPAAGLINSMNPEPVGLSEVSHYVSRGEGGEEPFLFSLTFSARPRNPFAKSEQTGHQQQADLPVLTAAFFMPSVDVLTALRTGGLRMGSLSPTAKWKEM